MEYAPHTQHISPAQKGKKGLLPMFFMIITFLLREVISLFKVIKVIMIHVGIGCVATCMFLYNFLMAIGQFKEIAMWFFFILLVAFVAYNLTVLPFLFVYTLVIMAYFGEEVLALRVAGLFAIGSFFWILLI